MAVFHMHMLIQLLSTRDLGTGPFHIAVARFESNVRYGQHGVLCSILFHGGLKCIVTTQKNLKKNQWVKIQLRNTTEQGSVSSSANLPIQNAQLIEILGPVYSSSTPLFF
jgi:hypothetical protein